METVELEKDFEQIDKLLEKHIGKKCSEFDMFCSICSLRILYEKFKIDLINEMDGK